MSKKHRQLSTLETNQLTDYIVREIKGMLPSKVFGRDLIPFVNENLYNPKSYVRLIACGVINIRGSSACFGDMFLDVGQRYILNSNVVSGEFMIVPLSETANDDMVRWMLKNTHQCQVIFDLKNSKRIIKELQRLHAIASL